MKEVTDFMQVLWPYVFLVAGLVVYVYHWAQAHNKNLAEKMQGLYEVAKNIVAQEATTDKSGAEKKLLGTASLVKQANEFKVPLTTANAQGMIERAYSETQTQSENKPAEMPQPVEVTTDEIAE